MQSWAPPFVSSILSLALAAPAAGQTQTYPVRQYATPYVPLTGGTAVVVSGGFDDGAGPAPIGFTFRYFDVDYISLNAGINGVLAFAAPCGAGLPACQAGESCNGAQMLCRRSNFTHIPQNPANVPNPPNRLLAPLWNDLELQRTGTPVSTLTYQTTGTAPNRVFTIQYENFRRHPLGPGHALINFQVSLLETSNVIRYNYGPYVSGTDNAMIMASIEIKSPDGQTVVNGHDCSGPPTWRPACTYMTLQSLTDQAIEFGAPDAPLLTGAVFPPNGARPGDTVPFIIRADNAGRQSTGVPFQTAVYLSSRSGTVSPIRDTLLGTVTFDELDALSSDTSTLTARIPPALPPGYYTIGALFDSTRVVPQPTRAGNLVVNPRRFLIGDIPDFRIALRSFPRTSQAGEALGTVLELRNIGFTVPRVSWEVRLTRNLAMDPVGIRVAGGVRTLTTTAAESLTVFTVTSTIPNIVPGNYNLIAIVNPGNAIPSADPTNNRVASATQMTLLGADLVAVSVVGPRTAFRGLPYPVTFAISNNGMARAANFRYAFYFAESQLITVFAHQIGELGPITLAPAQRVMMTVNVTVPAGLAGGMYYLGLIADVNDQVMQEIPTHKITRQLERVLVRDTAPQFAVSEINFAAAAIAGQSLTVQRSIDNTGNAAGSAPYGVVLSRTRTIDPMLAPLGMGIVTLPAGAVSTDVDRIRIPADTAPGNYYVGYVVDADQAVDQLDRAGNIVVATMPVEVLSPQLAIRTRDLPLATTGTPYQVDFSATGGAGPYVWSLASGTLPDGLRFDPNGTLSGTPTTEGMSSFRVAVSDGSLTIDKAYSVLVTAPTNALQIVSRAVPPAFVGRPYEFPLTAVGGVVPYTWSADRRPPARIRLEPDGRLAGTATAAGVAVVNFKVTDATGRSSERPIVVRAIDESDAVQLATDALPDGVINTIYPDVPLRALRGMAPYVFDVGEGAMPDGLVIDGNKVTGTPKKVGLFTFLIRVTDARGSFDLNRFVVNISENNGVRFVTKVLPRGMKAVDYVDATGMMVRLRAVASGTTSAIRYGVLSGALPAGVTLEPDGRIHGKPTNSGVFAFTAAATNVSGETDLRAFGIAIDDPAEMKTTTPKSSGCSCGVASGAPLGGGRSKLPWLGTVLLLGLLFSVRLRKPRRLIAASVLANGVIALADVGSAEAQTMPAYRLSNFTQPYVHRTGGTNLVFLPSATTGAATVTLPFMFRFFNNDYATGLVSTKGYLTFGPNGTSASPHVLPSTIQPTNLIALFWESLQTLSGSITIEGTAPNRVAVIQWANVSRTFSTGFTWEMQLWLYEGPAGRFEIHYGPTTGNPGTVFLRAVSGFENQPGNTGFMFLPCAANCSSTQLAMLPNTVYRAIADGGPHPVALSVRSPFRVYQDVPFTVTSSIVSLHGNPIGPFVYAVHLIRPGEIIPTNPIFTSGPITLDVFEARLARDRITLPATTPPGRYRVALEVDSTHQITDPDRSRAIVIARSDVLVSERLPDFTVFGVTTPATMVAPGGSLPVTVRLSNAGNLDAVADWKIYLSRRREVTIDNLAVHAASVSLAASATATVSVVVTIPTTVTPGRYYVGVIVDPDNRVREIDKLNNAAATTSQISIGVSTVGLATAAIPGGYVGADYSTFLRPTGGDGAYTYQVSGGALPAGITLDPTTGEIRGKPMLLGRSPFTIRVTSNGQSGEGNLVLDVIEVRGDLTIVTRDLTPGIVGQTYPPAEAGVDVTQQQHIFAVGGAGPAMFSLGTPATIPAGLTLDTDGYVHGVPRLAGHFDIDVRATDGAATVSRAIAMSVVEPGKFSLLHTSLPDGVIDQFYEFQIQTVGRRMTSTVTYALTSDVRQLPDDPPGTTIHDKRLPDGLALTSLGRITGTPRRVGLWRFGIEAVEGMGPTAGRSTSNYTITVGSNTFFKIMPTSLPNAVVNKPYLVALEVTGGTPPIVWRTIGPQAFPPGLKSEIVQKEGRETLRIYGTPAALPEPVEDVQVGGVVTFLVTVTDALGLHAQQEIALRVVEAPKDAPATSTKKSGCICAAGGERGARSAAGLVVLGLGLGLGRVLRARARLRQR